MEAATGAAPARELGGEKAQRIVAAMRASVAKRGILGSTFDHVAREANVSRGLLHYYFGTKERLLVEVVRHDSELRIQALDEPLLGAQTVDDVINVLVASLEDVVDNDPSFFLLLFELFAAGRRNPEIRAELEQMYDRSRNHVAEILLAKERDGVLKLRFDAHAIVTYLFTTADGYAVQRLSSTEPAKKELFEGSIEAGISAARHLLLAED